jgi:hypothetical protein
VVRRPSGFPERLRVVTADLAAAAPAALAAAVAGADAVLSGLGPRPISEVGITTHGHARHHRRDAWPRGSADWSSSAPRPSAPPPRPATRIRPSTTPAEGFFMRHLLSPMIKMILRKHYDDLARMEDALRESDLAWTAVRPASADQRQGHRPLPHRARAESPRRPDGVARGRRPLHAGLPREARDRPASGGPRVLT